MEENTDPPLVTITQCVTLKLTDKNYFVWKLQFEQFLSSQSLLGYVTGATQRPPPTMMVQNGEQTTEVVNPEFTKWVRSDQNVMAWLYGSLSENALKTIYGLRTSHEVWFTLAKRYNRVSPTRRFDLLHKVQNLRKGNQSMSDFLAEIKTLCDNLDSIGSPMSEEEKIYAVTKGLGKEYESICTVIENSMDMVPGLSFEDAVFKLIGFDEKLQTYNVHTDPSPHQVYYTNRGGSISLGLD